MLNGEDGYQRGIPVVGARAHISQHVEDRLPPQHIEAEMGVLGSILIDEEGAITDKIMAILSPEHFYRAAHQTMFGAMKLMHEAGSPIDAVTFSDELGPASLRDVGSIEYIAELIRSVPHEANGVYYAEIVLQKARSREVIELGAQMIRDGYSQQFTADDLVKSAAERIEAIECDTIRDDEQPVAEQKLRIGEAAFRGLAGKVVECILPETEACGEAILLQFLTAIGNLFGPNPHFKVGPTKHRCNLFTCIVAPTGMGKGMSWDACEWALSQVNPEWTAKPFLSGMTSGEGVITEAKELAGPVLAVETEFARVIVNMNREGNTLNAILRQGWESMKMRIPTKNNPVYVENAHLSVIAHVPPGELKGKLSPGDIENGLVNRFLWAQAYLAQFLPKGGCLENMERSLGPHIQLLAEAVVFAEAMKRPHERDAKAEAMWAAIYKPLRLRPPGPHGAATARATALTMRLALIYALLDRKRLISVTHLESALAVWDYCDATGKLIFGDGKTDSKTAKLVAGLEAFPEGLTRTEIARYVFKSHVNKDELARLLDQASKVGQLVYTERDTRGRKTPAWMHEKYRESAHHAQLRTPTCKD